MPNATAKYSGDKYEITFTASAKEDWMGDPSVPNGTIDFFSIEDIEVESLLINGEEVEFASLPEEEQATILALADDLEFEVEEADYDYDDRSADYN